MAVIKKDLIFEQARRCGWIFFRPSLPVTIRMFLDWLSAEKSQSPTMSFRSLLRRGSVLI